MAKNYTSAKLADEKQAAPAADPVEVVTENQTACANYNFDLVVLNPFESFAKGDLINSNEAIEAVINKGFLSNCIKRLRFS